MSRESQLAKNTFIISFGTFLPKIITVITLPIITAYLSKNEYGQYDLIATLVSLVLPVATLQIQSAAFRFLIDCRNNESQKKTIITSMIFYVVIISLTGTFVFGIVLRNISLKLRCLICFYFLVDMFLAVLQQIVRGLSFNKVYSISTILNSICNLLGIIALVQYMGKGLYGILFSMSFAAGISILFLFFKISLWKYIDQSFFSINTLKEMLSYSWPMIPNNLSNWVLKLSDRLVISAVLGIEANAVYAVANKIPNLFVTVQSTFIYAWQENASLAVNDSDTEIYYSNIFSAIFNMLVGIMASVIALTPVMFSVLIKGDYDDAYKQMPILYMSMMFSCIASVLGGIYVAYKKTKSVGITTMLAAVCNLLIDIIFVRSIGITAGSISTLVSHLFLVIYRMIDVQKFQKISYDFRNMSKWLLILCLMCFICERNQLYLNIINVFAGIAVTCLSNKILIRNCYNKINNRIRERNIL